MLKEGGGFVIEQPGELEKLLIGWFDDPASQRKAAAAAVGVVNSRSGATDRLLEKLLPYLKA